MIILNILDQHPPTSIRFSIAHFAARSFAADECRTIVTARRRARSCAFRCAVRIRHCLVVEHAAVIRRWTCSARIDSGGCFARCTTRHATYATCCWKSERCRTIVGIDSRTRSIATRCAIESMYHIIKHASAIRSRTSGVSCSRIGTRRRRCRIATHTCAIGHHRRTIVGAVCTTRSTTARRAIVTVYCMIEDAAEICNRTSASGFVGFGRCCCCFAAHSSRSAIRCEHCTAVCCTGCATHSTA